MNAYPIFEKDLEKELTEDEQGRSLQEYQDALWEFVNAVNSHIGTGVGKDACDRWTRLMKAAELASGVAEQVRKNIRPMF